MPKMNVNLYVIEDYENEPPSGSKKQTQFKPNFFKGQNELKIACQKIWPHPCEMVGINFLTIYFSGGIF